MLAGQMHGGTVQGLGQALLERAIYDKDSGQLVTASLMDYALPRASDSPPFTFETRNVRCVTNALGVKGAGEAGSIGSCPAIMNAIVDALWRAYRVPPHRHAGDAGAHLAGAAKRAGTPRSAQPYENGNSSCTLVSCSQRRTFAQCRGRKRYDIFDNVPNAWAPRVLSISADRVGAR